MFLLLVLKRRVLVRFNKGLLSCLAPGKRTDACLQLKHLMAFYVFYTSQFEKLEGIPELGEISEQTEGEPAREERLGLPQASRDVLGVGTVIPQQVPIQAHTEPDKTVPQTGRVANKCYLTMIP